MWLNEFNPFCMISCINEINEKILKKEPHQPPIRIAFSFECLLTSPKFREICLPSRLIIVVEDNAKETRLMKEQDRNRAGKIHLSGSWFTWKTESNGTKCVLTVTRISDESWQNRTAKPGRVMIDDRWPCGCDWICLIPHNLFFESVEFRLNQNQDELKETAGFIHLGLPDLYIS